MAIVVLWKYFTTEAPNLKAQSLVVGYIFKIQILGT